MKKALGISLLLVLLSPLALFCLCFANPALLGFIEPVAISNQSKDELHAIPMGRGTRSLISPPLYWTRFPVAIPRGRTEFVIPAGESTSFNYDWDDVNLCWLLVRSESSNWKVVPSSLDIPSCALTEAVDGGCCRRNPDGFTFAIDDLESLPDAPPWLVAEASPDGGN